MRRAFGIVSAGATGLALLFLLVPLVALFTRVSPVDLARQLGSEAAVDALVVSALTNAVALAVVLVVGTPAAYLLATRRIRGRSLVLTLIELPLVLPPAVAGIALLATFSTTGLLGPALDAGGVTVPLTRAAVTIAVVFVASPFFLRGAIAAFEAVEPGLLDAARTLGASPFRVFRRVAMPLAASGLGAAATLAFARGLGEFGATIMFAGSIEGRTQTLPLMIYAQLGRDYDVALAVGALLVVVSIAILLTTKVLPGWTASTSISPFRSARSVSS